MIEGAGGLESGTLLLVEDDPSDTELMRVWLRRSSTDWNLIHVQTLREAVTTLESVTPDLIVSDLGLPDAQGLQAAEELTKVALDVPLVVLTGATRPELAVRALALGAQDYINKDQISEDTLRRAINFAITRHRSQRQLATLEGSLAIADEDLEQYASMVAHDLRAPLRTSRLLSQAIGQVLANSDGAKSDSANSDGRDDTATDRDVSTTCGQVADLAHRLDTTLGRLDEIVLSMLDYSNVNRSEPEVGPVEVRPIVEEVIGAVQADLQQAEADVVIDIEPDLAVTGAPTAMWRVIENLVSNSIKFRSPDRPLEIHVAASSQDHGRAVRVEVRDNGIGIPSSESSRIFRPLERLDTQTEGSGFGLAICRRHLTAMNGTIWLDKPETHGSKIVFELPCS